jgi:amino acid transporter
MTGFLALHKDVVIGKAGTYAIGIVPILFLIIYIIVTILSYKYDDNDQGEPVKPKETASSDNENIEETKPNTMTVKKAITGFIIFAILTAIIALVLN